MTQLLNQTSYILVKFNDCCEESFFEILGNFSTNEKAISKMKNDANYYIKDGQEVSKLKDSYDFEYGCMLRKNMFYQKLDNCDIYRIYPEFGEHRDPNIFKNNQYCIMFDIHSFDDKEILFNKIYENLSNEFETDIPYNINDNNNNTYIDDKNKFGIKSTLSTVEITFRSIKDKDFMKEIITKVGRACNVDTDNFLKAVDEDYYDYLFGGSNLDKLYGKPQIDIVYAIVSMNIE